MGCLRSSCGRKRLMRARPTPALPSIPPRCSLVPRERDRLGHLVQFDGVAVPAHPDRNPRTLSVAGFRVRDDLPAATDPLAGQAMKQKQPPAQQRAAEHHVRHSRLRPDPQPSVVARPRTRGRLAGGDDESVCSAQIGWKRDRPLSSRGASGQGRRNRRVRRSGRCASLSTRPLIDVEEGLAGLRDPSPPRPAAPRDPDQTARPKRSGGNPIAVTVHDIRRRAVGNPP